MNAVKLKKKKRNSQWVVSSTRTTSRFRETWKHQGPYGWLNHSVANCSHRLWSVSHLLVLREHFKRQEDFHSCWVGAAFPGGMWWQVHLNAPVVKHKQSPLHSEGQGQCWDRPAHTRPSKLGQAAHGDSEGPDVRRGIRAVCAHHREGNLSLSPALRWRFGAAAGFYELFVLAMLATPGSFCSVGGLFICVSERVLCSNGTESCILDESSGLCRLLLGDHRGRSWEYFTHCEYNDTYPVNWPFVLNVVRLTQ